MEVDANFSREQYIIGLICALPPDMAAVRAMLDKVHKNLPAYEGDDNSYVLGSIGPHNVAIACLPSGSYGTTSATSVALRMKTTFRSIRFGFMIGIGAGVPQHGSTDIRLGDIVVSTSVIQYDYDKALNDNVFQPTRALTSPPKALSTAVASLRSKHIYKGSDLPRFMGEMLQTYPLMLSEYSYPGQNEDRLFQADYPHASPLEACNDYCDNIKLVQRCTRTNNQPAVQYGKIASGNQVVKSSSLRDRLAEQFEVCCIEMEAAGLMDDFPCLVTCGICDYADSHKNDQWQGYAAAGAAAYAKELLLVIPPQGAMRPAVEQMADSTVDSSKRGPAKRSMHRLVDHPARPAGQFDVKDYLAKLAREKDNFENWASSIVDLLKLINLKSDPRAREKLADILDVHVATPKSARQNDTLRIAVLRALTESKGQVPVLWKRQLGTLS